MRLHDHLEFHAQISPEATFSVFRGLETSYRDADRSCNRIARALLADGLVAGDRVAILARNCADYLLFYYGCSKAGIVPVPLNYRLSPREWSYILNDSGARLLVAGRHETEALSSIRDSLGHVKHFVCLDGTSLGEWIGWSEWLAVQSAGRLETFIEDDCDVYQMYTSGTTGRPKGAVLTHRAVTQNLTQLSGVERVDPGDRYLIVAPLYHAAAAVASFWVVTAGGCLVIHEEFDPSAVVDALSSEGIIGTTLVPAMIQACLLGVPGIADRDFSELRFVIYGASPIAEQTLRGALEVFGCGFYQGYGMTETTAAASFLMAGDHERALREKPELLLSAGRPLPGTEIRIVDERDRPVSPGQVGEILIRGPQLMRGYWNLPEATAEALAGGWMHTGDAGQLDAEGFLYIQDRVKDMIVSGGENVYPREIEDVLFEHPQIADAAVIGVPSERFGEEVKAIVVLREGEEAEVDEIIAFCRERLAGYKRPRSLDFVESLPRNASGKVLKKELREPYWQGHSRRVS